MSREPTRTFGVRATSGRLRRALVHRPTALEFNPANWTGYGYAGAPDLSAAQAEHDLLMDLLVRLGVELEPLGRPTSINSTSTCDAAVVTDAGAVVLRSGKVQRQAEAAAVREAFDRLGIPVLGTIGPPGCVDGGDLFWLDGGTLAAGLSYRTNRDGLVQLARCLAPAGVLVEAYDLPHWEGPGSVLHLTSVVSLVTPSLAIAYESAVPLRLLQDLRSRGVQVLAVPEAELASQGCNVLAAGERDLVIGAGNPITAGRLREHGMTVHEVACPELFGRRLSGPTCHVLALLRD